MLEIGNAISRLIESALIEHKKVEAVKCLNPSGGPAKLSKCEKTR